MSATPPPPNSQQPPKAPPPLPGYPPPPEGRGVAFYVALFLALLLLFSGGLNVVLLMFSALSGAGQLGGEVETESIDAGYRLVRVSGQKNADARILRIRVEGAISEGASPVMGAMGGMVSEVRRQLQFAARNKRIKGVLLEINSPGGGVTDSEEIHRLIEKFRKDEGKPVVAYFGDISASGGYYIAAACDRIVCHRTTITGSIGVIMSSYNFAELMAKYGIKTETIISPNTPFKDIMSMSRAMRDEERQILLSIVEEMYQRFVDVVDAGRPNLTREQVKTLADGRIYSAGQAVENGLVDEILDPEAALAAVAKLASAQEVELVEQRRQPTLMDALLGQPGAAAPSPSLQETAARYLDQTTGSRFLYFWPGGR